MVSLRTGLVVLAGAVALSTASPALLGAQGKSARKSAPAGQEIAARAKKGKLDHGSKAEGKFQGKKITLIPADLSDVKSPEELEAGQFVGVMETEVAGDETGLPPGKYNLFVANVDGNWHMYAESGGQIVKEALRVSVDKTDKNPGKRKPEFHEVGWGWSWYPTFSWWSTSSLIGQAGSNVIAAGGYNFSTVRGYW